VGGFGTYLCEGERRFKNNEEGKGELSRKRANYKDTNAKKCRVLQEIVSQDEYFFRIHKSN
jgi:hypothetical protein